MPRRKPDLPPAINEDYTNFKLEIKRSKIHRWGNYVAENIQARRKVMEYTGERISRKETKRRSEEQGRMIYLFTLDKYWTLDGAVDAAAFTGGKCPLLLDWIALRMATSLGDLPCTGLAAPYRGEVSLFLL